MLAIFGYALLIGLVIFVVLGFLFVLACIIGASIMLGAVYGLLRGFLFMGKGLLDNID